MTLLHRYHRDERPNQHTPVWVFIVIANATFPSLFVLPLAGLATTQRRGRAGGSLPPPQAVGGQEGGQEGGRVHVFMIQATPQAAQVTCCTMQYLYGVEAVHDEGAAQ